MQNETFKAFDWLKNKPQNVQNVVIEMAYQMGVAKVKKFSTTLHYIRNSEYEKAVQNGLNSLFGLNRHPIGQKER